jgi:hypothetical protein
MILTQTQQGILAPLIKAKNQSDINLQDAIRLIVGKEFSSYSIKDGELSIVEIPEVKEEK